jgi:hypothetical protein
MLAAFLMTLTLSLAYYHRRCRLGVGGATLSLILPFFVNILWAKYLGHSLVYPTAALVTLGALVLCAGHRKISGPHWEGDTENELIENLAEDMACNFNWKDRVTWLCFVSGAILLLILLLR